MRDPVIASVGHVRAEVPANRAGFGATFQSIERSAADASRKAADQIRALSQALAAYGVDAVRVETAITTRPIYEQYRDEAGVLRDNVRPDRIARYQADASVNITVRDVSVLERVYATVIASEPTSTSRVSFQPRSGQRHQHLAAGRGGQGRGPAGARGRDQRGGHQPGRRPGDRSHRPRLRNRCPGGLAVLLIGAEQATTVDDVVVTGSRVVRSARSAAAASPAGPGATRADRGPDRGGQRLALQPPLRGTDSRPRLRGLCAELSDRRA
jgi:hypothetical protein